MLIPNTQESSSLVLPIIGYETQKICLIFENGWNNWESTNINGKHSIGFIVSETYRRVF